MEGERGDGWDEMCKGGGEEEGLREAYDSEETECALHKTQCVISQWVESKK